MPIDKSKINWDKPRNAPIKKDRVSWDHEPWYHVGSMKKTLQNVAVDALRTTQNMGSAAAVAETAANFATSTYGVPISGLVGLGTLLATGDLDKASQYMGAAQKFLIYDPQTQAGQELTDAAMYPMEKVEQAGNYVGGKIDNPNLAAIADTAVTASPMLLAAKGMRRSPNAAKLAGREIETGINKAVRPSVVKKEVLSQRKKYMKNADVAVKEIIKNKDNLKLVDREGNPTSGLPKSLDEFNQAIDQTKRNIFERYDAMAKNATDAVPMDPIAAELDGVINNRVMQTTSPETVKYAIQRQQSLLGKKFSATETQEIIQMLNQSQDAFYKNPTPEMKGKAYVDSLIANNLRAGLDATIQKASGPGYQGLKRKYGALRMLETDVTKRAIVDARKNIKGLIDFTDVFSSHQLVYGMFSGQPASMAAGITANLASKYIKWVNDPNRIVKSMFKKAEKYTNKSQKKPGFVNKSMLGIGLMEGQINEEQ